MCLVLDSEKILIVDDSEMNRSILADMPGDYEILETENGSSKVERAYDLGATDLIARPINRRGICDNEDSCRRRYAELSARPSAENASIITFRFQWV